MLKWLKELFREEITVDEFMVGSTIIGRTVGHPYAVDITPIVKQRGVVSRIFKDARHDN
jgi:hypothetical protein